MKLLAEDEAAATGESGATWAPTVAFAVLVAGLAIFRFAVMVRAGAPPGADAGNWLAFGHAFLGERIRPTSLVYPPLVPLGVTAAVGLFGVTAGVAAFAALSSIAPAVALYTVLRAHGLMWPAVLLAGVTGAASVSSEPAAWGGYPQLLAIAFLVLFTWQLDGALRGAGRRAAVWAGVLLALVAATSHLVLVGAVLTAVALVAIHLAWPPDGERIPIGVLARTGLWVVLPSLLLVPIYAGLAASVSASAANRGHGDVEGAGELLRRLDLLHADFRMLGRVLMLAAPIVLVSLFPRRRTALWAMAAATLAGALAVIVLTREVRFLYLVPPAAVLALGLWFAELRRADTPVLRRALQVATGLLVVALGVQLVTGADAFNEQTRYYAAIDEDLTAAIEWLRDETPTDSVVAVTPVHDWPLGWWVEGLGRRSALSASALRWLNFPDERRRARIANEIFGLSAPNAGMLERARAAGADYVLVAKPWAGYAGAGLAEVRDAIVLDNPGAVVLKT